MEGNNEVEEQEVTKQENNAQSATQTNGFAKWVDSLTSSRIVVFFCVCALGVLALQYFFTYIAYVGVIYTICQVLKLLCVICAGIAFGFKLLRTKGVTLDGTFVMFMATVFMSFLFA